jgi:hypothetical protein
MRRLGTTETGTMRRRAFEGYGLMDYDVRSCNWSIFLSLGRAIGVSTSHAQGYVRHKDEQHAFWAKLTGSGRPADYKMIALSWLTGADLAALPHRGAVKRSGRPAMQTLSQQPAAQSLHAEARAGMQRVIEYTKGIGNVQ